MNNTAAIERFDNPAPRCPCALLLDTSGSMTGAPIKELNQGVERFFNEIMEDEFARFSVETGIISFGGNVSEEAPLTSCAHVEDVKIPRLKAGGCTPMGGAIKKGQDMLDNRKKEYKRDGLPYYQPWMVIMTDGGPNDNWQQQARQARQLAEQKKLILIGVGIGPRVDMETLSSICPKSARLEGLRFIEFFEWLSASLSNVSRSSPGDGTVELPATDEWRAIEV